MITCSPEGDEAKNQYERFLLNIVVQDGEKFLKFGMKKDRINVFRAKYFNGSDSNKLVWSVMLFSFPRCHMVTWPISGLDFFSTNADIMLENLHNDSFIAKRIVYNHMKSKDPQPSKLRKRYSM